jgi:hypothetical protein
MIAGMMMSRRFRHQLDYGGMFNFVRLETLILFLGFLVLVRL